MDHVVVNFKNRPDLYDLQEEICGRAFPTFLYYSDIAHRYWEKMIAYFREYQLLLLEGGQKDGKQIMAVINVMPMHLDIADADLPDDAFNWGLAKGVRDFEEGRKMNAVMGVQIVIPPEYQGRGVSAMAIRALKAMCGDRGIQRIIIPLRPTLKSKYPLTAMDRYIQWKSREGRPFDPWLRVHVRQGAKIIKPCAKAVEIKGTVADWEKWTGMHFPESGAYIVEGALCPVHMDREADQGIYEEPNVWISYS